MIAAGHTRVKKLWEALVADAKKKKGRRAKEGGGKFCTRYVVTARGATFNSFKLYVHVSSLKYPRGDANMPTAVGNIR